MVNESLTEQRRLDVKLSSHIAVEDRERLWMSARSILNSHTAGNAQSTLALGYVQSGKTTSISALCALAADSGYRVIVAILGSTNLLLDQNRIRVEASLGFEEHNYKWISLAKLRGADSAKEIISWLDKDRIVFIPVIKNSTQLNKISQALAQVPSLVEMKTLIIDDEADQASLNTRPDEDDPSSTYAAILALRASLSGSLYVQYTATPYAPLLLEPDDPLMPSAIEFLTPGTGYTGGKEFFIEHADSVIRPIPFTDESTTRPISALPESLEVALAAFVAGAAVLIKTDPGSPPISMLVHATHRNDGQARYNFLLERYLKNVKQSPDLPASPFGTMVGKEWDRLTALGVPTLSDEEFWSSADLVLKELTLWLINSATDVKKISWNYSPFHLLIGGNKLDRGFTVEGLTVTYMNRKPSDQIDTLEQRARAFGYRQGLLPYCQVFASPRTIRLLQGIVHTEDDLRANLYDWIGEGGLISGWAQHVGLDIPAGARPTRSNVIASLRSFNTKADWHSLRRPNLDRQSLEHNRSLVTQLGLLDAPLVDYGRLSFRTLTFDISQVVSEVMRPWAHSDLSPSWRHEEIVDHLRRHPQQHAPVSVILMARDDHEGSPRERAWEEDIGFVNLFQGRDVESRKEPRYEGDRSAGRQIGRPSDVVLQIHYVQRKGISDEGIFTPAIYLGDRQVIRVKGEEK